MSEIAIAFGLTLFAGLATGIGSAIAFFAKRTNFRFLSISTGFSAGVMLYVSFVEIFFKGSEALTEVYGDYWGEWINVGAFFGGIVLIGLIDAFIPQAENPHEVRSERAVAPLHNDDVPDDIKDNPKLMRMGLFTALAIGIHNFPEGLATFLAALHDPSVGVVIAVAIALHNIPEGISVSVPIYYATGDRKKAFLYSFLSGLAEPIGALIAYGGIVLFTGGSGGAVPQEVMGVLFAGVAGIMVYISLDELIPTSNAYGKGHDSMIGLVGGMAVMALSLLMMS
ncbi:zinc transporter ZupT [Dethiosulfovibrio salsuginis]|uniref:Zinc transporter ZupT n=1 Tax=Dethiosulfovibrio salsuginis TaxID=561720 RepID=A0A1X7J4C0_9BACT|nr:zinc transporter ZupT [Dethiosulfovibrio salsuginis]SMG22362.1 zinc transporter, ZIP family [Dethiosulfovibrio salsuginis]